MLNNKLQHFRELVRQASAEVGNSPPRIADAIMMEAFPETCAAATIEGADKMLRDGMIAQITHIMKSAPEVEGQGDFSSIDPAFQPIVSKLKSKTYYVAKMGEQVGIPDLIADPSLLDDARRFMRQKGDECLAEANVLDELYAAVRK